METSEMAEDIKKKKTKATTSDVWRYFTKLGPGDDGIDRAQCDGCKQKFKAGGKQYGTSSLKRHLDRKSKPINQTHQRKPFLSIRDQQQPQHQSLTTFAATTTTLFTTYNNWNSNL
ncbi:hypothetical protein Ahy_B03g065806 [Arachis hypogaea]|uniref:BED-type domain-containing protein n=1 Tax=Arachis hypogaea TaxID=3818 RepID=A0A445A2M5_ARAHY|nr:hypothetical protein Ahy_B03g065806 [Arachis hypogaea]